MTNLKTEHSAADYLSLAQTNAEVLPGIASNMSSRPIRQAAVIGAGTMGGGIALCFAQAGIPVTLIDVKTEALASGMARVRSNLEISVERGSLSKAESEARLARINGAVGLDSAAGADIVIEAAFEDMQLKAEIFSALELVTRPDTVLATNTSYLDVNEIAATLKRPENCLGLHFFSPANVMRLLEIVRAEKTAPDVLQTGLQLGRLLGKVSVVVGVCYGFVGNRMLAVRTAAAERLMLEGALPHQIDKAVTDFGFKMGPFAVSDLAGLDIGWRARMASGRKAPIADALCENGWFGQKSKRGFYRYPEGARKGERDPGVEALISKLSQQHGIERRAFSNDEILARMFYPMVNEGMRIIEEGIASRASDIDVVWVNGYSWPAATGGPMYWAANAIGLNRIVAELDVIADQAKDPTLRACDYFRRMIL